MSFDNHLITAKAIWNGKLYLIQIILRVNRYGDNHFDTRNHGPCMRDCLHLGHLLGADMRVRSLKVYLQLSQWAGVTCQNRPLVVTDLAAWGRWETTSFSLILNAWERSLMSMGACCNKAIIFWRIVLISFRALNILSQPQNQPLYARFQCANARLIIT